MPHGKKVKDKFIKGQSFDKNLRFFCKYVYNEFMPKKKRVARKKTAVHKRNTKKAQAQSKDVLLIVLGGIAILAMFALMTR